MAVKALGALLGIGPGACVALIGGGGKTTTMRDAARWAAEQGYPTVVTTTTKITAPDDLPLLLADQIPDLPAAVERALEWSPIVAVGQRARADGKMIGLDPATVEDLRGHGRNVVLGEADGARMRPLKVHGAHEPVIPGSSTHVVVVIGLDAIGARAEEVVHRHEIYAELVAGQAGDRVTVDDAAAMLVRAASHAPSGARLAILCNKADDPGRVDSARAIARRLSVSLPAAEVYAAVQGEVVEVLASPDEVRS